MTSTPTMASKAPKPDPEVLAKGKRRSFTAEYKSRILAEVDRCKHDGEIGALLRREGLYSSHLATWRAQRAEGGLAGLGRRRGPKPTPADPSAARIAELERENAKLRLRAEKAELLVDLQKKLAQILEQPSDESDESK
jgi:transposase